MPGSRRGKIVALYVSISLFKADTALHFRDA
jgi:hypothetical protein